jgi:7-cyano-7-deazaguanine synthase in queuosine biosynthesis
MSAIETINALFLCDGAVSAHDIGDGPWMRQEHIRTRGPRADLNLQLDPLDTQLQGAVSGIANDLLYIACCCMAADQRINRGSKQIDVHRRKWRRHFTMVVPVSSPKVWNRSEVASALSEALRFATDDEWSFSFVKQPPHTLRQTLFGKATDRAMRGNPDCVVLFSGGMDSLCAMVEATVDEGRRPLALSFRSAHQTTHGQVELVRSLRQRLDEWWLPHVGFSAHRQGGQEPDTSQRSRAFVLAALGCAVAESLGIQDVLLPDNGYVSINPPISGELAGALASRSTHPTLLRLVNDLVSLLFPDQSIMVANPLADRTRAEALEILKRYGFQGLITQTLTCGKFRSHKQSRAVPHCGTCSQCVDRRFAVVTAGLEEIEPADRYVVDLFTQELAKGEAMKVAPMFVTFAQRAFNLSPEAIITLIPQLTSCLDPQSDDVERDALNLADLLWRHSREVTTVVAEMITRHRHDLAAGTLPERSLLRLIMGGASAVEVPQASRVVDSVSVDMVPTMERRGKYWHFVFQGEKVVVGHQKGFEYISRLLKAPHQEIHASLLASGGIGEVTSTAHAVDAGLRVGSMFDPVLDSKGEKSLRQEIGRLKSQREKGLNQHQVEEIDRQILELERYLARSRGLKGRPREFTGDDERARGAVTKAINRALAELESQLPALYLHLKDSIRTGRLVVYAPHPSVSWSIAV